MNSGKQISFQYGEVSPSLRFRSDAVSYSQGLSKLKNMYVRNAGGVSNRPGFQHIDVHPFQNDIPEKGSNPGIKGWRWGDASFSREFDSFYEFRRNTADVNGGHSFYFRNYNNSLSVMTTPSTFTVAAGARTVFYGATPQQIKHTPLGKAVVYSPAMRAGSVSSGPYLNLMSGERRNGVSGNLSIRTLAALMPPSLGAAVSALAPFMEVSYVMTELHDTGEEFIVGTIASAAISSPSSLPGGSICHPHPESQVRIFKTVPGGFTKRTITGYRLYRAAGRLGGFYKFVGAVPYVDGMAEISFSDFAGEDVSTNPPTDLTLKGGTEELEGANHAVLYQQRLVISFDATQRNTGSNLLGASKIGAPFQLEMPAVFSPVGAFTFSSPVTDGTKINGLLDMERLIVTSQKAIYVVRGSDNGIITPTTVNPSVISQEGGSDSVAPKKKGRIGVILSFDHSKIVGVAFGDDGNLTTFNMSEYSDHLVTEDIHQIEVLDGREDTVFILKKDGTMVRVTVGSAPGFSTVETDGFIESIFTGYEERPYTQDINVSPVNYEVLYAYVIRDGIRRLEKLVYREQKLSEGMNFADASSMIGERLAKDVTGAWQRRILDRALPATFASGAKLNIRAPGTFNVGDTIYVESSAAVPPLANDYRIDFYIELDGSVEKFRFRPVISGASGDVNFPFRLTGTFDKDLPVELQDVFAQAISTREKESRHSRFTVSYKEFTGLTHLANKDVSVFADGEVLSSPLNPLKPTITVSGAGVLTLPDYVSYGVVGLPYVSEMETLDLEASDNRTFTDSNKLINAVGVAFLESRGGYAGIESQGVAEMSPINYTKYEGFGFEDKNFNGHIEIPIPAQWSEKGRVNIKQTDPLPLTVLAVYPKGMVGN